MKAVRFHSQGGTDVLRFEDAPVPEPGDGQVLLRVMGTSVNHLDISLRDGSAGIKVKMPHTGGCDAVGTVVYGEGKEGQFGEGDLVVVNPSLSCGQCQECKRGEASLCSSFAILGEHTDGAFAEYVVVPERNLKLVPSGFPIVKAAAAPLVYLTAWHALVKRARIRFGERVLVTGGSGGVSTAGIQIAKLFDAEVVATTRSEAKAEALRRLGADDVIVTGAGGWGRRYLEQRKMDGFDIVLDSVGAALWEDSVRSLRKGGRLVNYGRTSGGSVDAELGHLFWKQLQITGSTMGDPSDFETVMNLVFSRRLDPVVDGVFSLRDAARAQERVASASQLGKVVMLAGEA